MEQHKHADHHEPAHTHDPIQEPASAPVAPAAVAVAKDHSALYIPGAIVIAGLIIGVSLIVAFKGSSNSAAQAGTGAQPTAAKVDIKDVKISDTDPYIGDKNAKVTLVAWEDYQCPFCKAVEVGHAQIQVAPAMPALIKDYVKTGKLRIVFKDYPFLGDDSKIAALYGHSVWKLYPDKFYDWRVAMFTKQDEEGDKGFGDEASILALVKSLGMDSAKIKADVTANVAAYQALVDADRAEGSSFGITGTPGFITGKVLIPGAVGIDEFRKAIDPQL